VCAAQRPVGVGGPPVDEPDLGTAGTQNQVVTIEPPRPAGAQESGQSGVLLLQGSVAGRQGTGETIHGEASAVDAGPAGQVVASGVGAQVSILEGQSQRYGLTVGRHGASAHGDTPGPVGTVEVHRCATTAEIGAL